MVLKIIRLLYIFAMYIYSHLCFKNEITITTYRNGKYEKFTGVIQGANPETKIITFDAGNYEYRKISTNIIVDVE
jgi:hypothetical protein